MKTRILLYSLAVSTMISCQKEPEALISVNKPVVEFGESFHFNNNSVNAETYHWEFGDGSTSVDKSPVKKYNSAGTYSVTMTAYSKNKKKSDAESITVTVNPPKEDESTKFAGVYIVSENYTSDYCGNAPVSYTITINKSGPNSITINNFAGLELNNINANVTGNNFVIPSQYGKTSVGSETWDVLSGSGSISGTTINFNYTVSDSNYNNYCGYMVATCIAYK